MTAADARPVDLVDQVDQVDHELVLAALNLDAAAARSAAGQLAVLAGAGGGQVPPARAAVDLLLIALALTALVPVLAAACR